MSEQYSRKRTFLAVYWEKRSRGGRMLLPSYLPYKKPNSTLHETTLKKTTLQKTWDEVFPSESVDATVVMLPEEKKSVSTVWDAKIRAAEFFNLPAAVRDGEVDIFRQLLLMPAKAKNANSTLKTQMSEITRGIFSFIFIGMPRLLLVSVPTTLINTVKLGSEFPLTLLRNAFMSALKINSIPAALVITGLYGLASLAIFAVRAVTSPVKNARMAYTFGQRIANGGKAGMLWGLIAGGLSVLATAAAYTLLFPLGVKFIAAQVLPNLIPQLPLIVTKVASIIGVHLAPVVTPVLNALHLAVSAPLLGLSAVAASALATIGSGLVRLKDRVSGTYVQKKVSVKPSQASSQAKAAANDAVNDPSRINNTQQINQVMDNAPLIENKNVAGSSQQSQSSSNDSTEEPAKKESPLWVPHNQTTPKTENKGRRHSR